MGRRQKLSWTPCPWAFYEAIVKMGVSGNTYKSTRKEIIRLGDYRLKVRITFLVKKIITRPWASWIYENRRSMSSKKTTRCGEAFLGG
jgi:hypothetical protein